jgi:hypothetical protein
MQAIRSDLSLTFTQADVVTFRSNEIAARDKLYNYYRAQFLRFLGAEAYVRKYGGWGSGGGGSVA